MSDQKRIIALDELRAKMPRNYARLIEDEIGEEGFDNEAVRCVFRGQTTNQATVLKVLEAAKKVIEKQQQIVTLQNDLANSLA